MAEVHHSVEGLLARIWDLVLKDAEDALLDDVLSVAF